MSSNRSSNAAKKRQQSNYAGSSRSKDSALSMPVLSTFASDIVGVVLIAVSIALIIALLVPTQAPITLALAEFLRLCFGRGALLCPLALFLFALTFFSGENSISTRIAIGLILIVLAALSIFSLSYPGAENNPDIIVNVERVVRSRGGYVGGGIAWVLLTYLGAAVGAILLVCLALVGSVICGFSVSGAVSKVKTRLKLIFIRYKSERELRRQRDEEVKDQAQLKSDDSNDQSLVEDESDLTGEFVQSEPKTSFLGLRKTSVLRRTPHFDNKATAKLLPLKDETLKKGKPAESEIQSMPDFLREQKNEIDNASTDEHSFSHEDDAASSSKTLKRAQKQKKKTAHASPVKTGLRPGDEDKDYELPPLSMLSSNPHSSQSASSDMELKSTARRLQSTLVEFGLTSKVVDYVAGPLVTTFQVEMGEGERVNKIVNLEDDIALTLAAESVRIFAPIPGTSRVGIEIPNKRRENVHLGDVLPYAKGGSLEFAVGRDSEGKAVIADLAKMPHLLVAGATGSGKSVMINSLIMSILMRDTPKQVRLILVDPKRVEFAGYNGLPHLYVPVVTEPRQAASALQWAVSEMERRLKVFERAGARNIGAYNAMCTSGKLAEAQNPPSPMPFMVIIIDELADLMMVAGKDVEASIVRIAQLARAAGIHLVLATQRPSADVVTGLIKSNIETRIALSVASGTDSRVIIDQVGAQRLLGNGDMLFKYRGQRIRRVLGCFVSDSEIESVVDFARAQGEPDYHEEILTQISPNTPASSSSAVDDSDPLIWEAAQMVVESQLGSTSGLQRRLKVGYARAGRIMDELEAKGIVGPPDGSKPRDVLIDLDGLDELKEAEEKYREV